jgi:hypothetical protein
MDKLKNVIKEYGRWSVLELYIDRIEPDHRPYSLMTFFSLSIAGYPDFTAHEFG